MSIDEIIKAKKFITDNYKIDLDGRISYFKAAELMAEYHQSKVKEDALLHSVINCTCIELPTPRYKNRNNDLNYCLGCGNNLGKYG